MKRVQRKFNLDYIVTSLMAIAVAFFIRNFIIEAYKIPSLAMRPTLVQGDTLFVAKWPFELQKNYQPERGDVVVFSMNSGFDGVNQDFIKRIIGLPGDEIKILKGIVFLNGKSLKKSQTIDPAEDWVTEQFPSGKSYQVSIASPEFDAPGNEKVPNDSVYVLGDSRQDLRTLTEKKTRKGWGIVPITAIKGKALWIWLSIEPTRQSPWPFVPQLRWERMFRSVR